MSAIRSERSPWTDGKFRNSSSAGPAELLFGKMYEDSALECALFPPGGRIFCITSAGCTSLDLAATGRSVDAVDINPAQTQYAQQRLSGLPIRQGTADRMLQVAQRVFHRLLPDNFDLTSFLTMTDTVKQAHIWQTQVDRGWRSSLVNVLLNRRSLRLFYKNAFLSSVPFAFGTVLRKRLLRTLCMYPNVHNPYVRMLLADDDSIELPRSPITNTPRLNTADAVEFLNAGPCEIYDGFSLSNILDGAHDAYAKALRCALTRAAKPGAVLILRSIQEPRNEEESWYAARDRCAIWGRIIVRRIFPERWR